MSEDTFPPTGAHRLASPLRVYFHLSGCADNVSPGFRYSGWIPSCWPDPSCYWHLGSDPMDEGCLPLSLCVCFWMSLKCIKISKNKSKANVWITYCYIRVFNEKYCFTRTLAMNWELVLYHCLMSLKEQNIGIMFQQNTNILTLTPCLTTSWSLSTSVSFLKLILQGEKPSHFWMHFSFF